MREIGTLVCWATPEEIILQFNVLKDFYIRKWHIPIRHIIISFDSYYEYFISPYQASIIADELCRDVFAEEYQVIYGIHENTSNLHAHIIINTVSIDGHLLPWDYNTTNEIYESLKLILYRFSIWHGNFPIKNLKMVF